jgi:hypothetical protein
MASPPPRMGPTLVLAALWLALYLLWLGLRPQPPAPVEEPAVTTTTTLGGALR